jgi:hypothetical protein
LLGLSSTPVLGVGFGASLGFGSRKKNRRHTAGHTLSTSPSVLPQRSRHITRLSEGGASSVGLRDRSRRHRLYGTVVEA